MKKFLFRITIFSSIAFVFLLVFLTSTGYLIKKHSSFKISENIDKIVIGHSHPECAFNDALISNFKNFSSSGESYFYTRIKMAPLLEQNKQIKTVFVEFSNDQIEPRMNDWIWESKYLRHRYPKYAPFMSWQDYALLAKNNPSDFITSTGLVLRDTLWAILHKMDYSKIIGGYLHLERDKTESILATTKEVKPLDDARYKVSRYSLIYLRKIIDECKEKNIKVYLIRSPIHPKTSQLRNERVFRSTLHSRFSDVEFLDFKDFPLTNSEYGDLEHLNFRGAKKFSPFFHELLKNGLLDKTDKQAFIDDEMKNQ